MAIPFLGSATKSMLDKIKKRAAPCFQGVWRKQIVSHNLLHH